MDEFELITRCFRARTARRRGTVLGIGDDAALLDTGGLPLAHARATAPYAADGADAGAVALGVFGAAFIRLAAQAVTPRWATLGLTLEAGEPDRVERFAAATAAICEACGVELIGGDTTRGPGRATVFALGTMPSPAGRGRPAAPASAFRARLSPATVDAIADVVSVCTDLAVRGAEIQCNDPPPASEDACVGVMELVVHTDAAGITALRTVTDRLQATVDRADLRYRRRY